MTSAETTLSEKLWGHGYSLTKPRRLVFTTLQHRDTTTMHELIRICAISIDRASVYRTVAVFEQLGIVQRIQIGWKYQLELSDDFSDHHHHAVCMRCGIVLPLAEDSALEEQLAKLTDSHGFEPLSHQLEIRGLCKLCQQPMVT